jgi:opacity protein-like surface antigen
MMLRHFFVLAVALEAAIVAWPAAAQQRAGSSTETAGGFYGGVALRDAGVDSADVKLGRLPSTWGRFTSPVSDDAARRALVFGGYRWASDIALEGSFETADRYALQPADAGTPRGVGLALVATPIASRSWNADVYTSWSFRKSFALYGRFGYSQSDSVPAYALASLSPTDARRLRDGMNYGVGLRYDFSRALGLRLEYARFSRFAGEAITGPLPDSDQVRFGMQFRF